MASLASPLVAGGIASAIARERATVSSSAVLNPDQLQPRALEPRHRFTGRASVFWHMRADADMQVRRFVRWIILLAPAKWP
jgi:hypothetical protein